MKSSLNEILERSFVGSRLKGLSFGTVFSSGYMGIARRDAIGKKIVAARWHSGHGMEFRESGIVLTVVDSTGRTEDILVYEDESVDVEN